MSRFGLVPFYGRWYDDVARSHNLFDQFFGQSLFDDDLVVPRYSPSYVYHLRMLPDEGQSGPMRPGFNRQRSGLSRVSNDKNEFKVALDVQQFKPDEVSVKTVDNYVVIEGKHEEKEDEHGYISRHFVRRYMLPEGVKPETVKSTLSSDGVLSITAPKPAAIEKANERVVPITHSPFPAVASGTKEGGDAPAGAAGGAGQQEAQQGQKMES